MALPFYDNPCIATSPGGDLRREIFLAGIKAGELTVHKVQLGDINNPQVTRFGSSMSTNWTSSAQTRCVVPTTQTVVGYQSSAMVFHQITSPAGHAYVYDNGTTTDFFLFSELRSLESTKLYANTANGVTESFQFAYAKDYAGYPSSGWVALRFASQGGSRLTTPGSIPRTQGVLAVGASSTSTLSTQGYLVHFDTYRSGSVYTMSHSTGASEVASVRTPATAIKMDDIVLTSDAIGVNVGPTAYIVDKEPSGQIRLYSIQPMMSSTLAIKRTTSDVPTFSQGMLLTRMANDFILYRPANGSYVFNKYESALNRWTGPGLVAPPVEKSSSSSNMGAIIGGAVGGVVLLALIGFFLFRRSRRNKQATITQTVVHHPPPQPQPQVFAPPPAPYQQTPGSPPIELQPQQPYYQPYQPYQPYQQPGYPPVASPGIAQPVIYSQPSPQSPATVPYVYPSPGGAPHAPVQPGQPGEAYYYSPPVGSAPQAAPGYPPATTAYAP